MSRGTYLFHIHIFKFHDFISFYIVSLIRAIRGIAIARFVLLRNPSISSGPSSPSHTSGCDDQSYMQKNEPFRHSEAWKSALVDFYVLPEWHSLGGLESPEGPEDPRGMHGRAIGMLLRTCRPGTLEGEEHDMKGDEQVSGQIIESARRGSDVPAVSDYVAPRS